MNMQSPFRLLTLKREMCGASCETFRNHKPSSMAEAWIIVNKSLVLTNLIGYYLQDSSQTHLNNPIFINKKIWSLQISMHNDRVACVQVIHSFGLHEVDN